MNSSLSGYEIKQKFEDIFSYFYSSSYGTIYPMLHRMEKEGLLTKEIVIQDGRPNKNVYSITEKGKEQFNSYLYSPLEMDTFKSDFLMRLYFGQFAGNDKVIAWLKQVQQEVEQQLEGLSAKYMRHKDEMQPAHNICIQIGIKEYTAKLEAIAEGLASFEQIEMEKRD